EGVDLVDGGGAVGVDPEELPDHGALVRGLRHGEAVLPVLLLAGVEVVEGGALEGGEAVEEARVEGGGAGVLLVAVEEAGAEIHEAVAGARLEGEAGDVRVVVRLRLGVATGVEEEAQVLEAVALAEEVVGGVGEELVAADEELVGERGVAG